LTALSEAFPLGVMVHKTGQSTGVKNFYM
jgi:hypothetical protein